MDITDKLNVLTSIPTQTFDSLWNVVDLIHSDDIITQYLESKDVFELPIIEGKIYIKLDDNDVIKYKFVPNEIFSNTVKETILNKKSKLMTVAIDKLKDGLTKTYKDIF